MGLFELIQQKRYQEFCNIYEANEGLKEKGDKFQDLMPGNYLLALLGKGDYEKAAEVSFRIISEKGPDRSASTYHMICSVAKMELGQIKEAYEVLYEGRNAAYQDLSRTEIGNLLYYEAVMTGDEKTRRAGERLLNSRLKKYKGGLGESTLASMEFSIASFIMGGCTEREMLNEIDGFSENIIRNRYKVRALFYTAIKNYDMGDTAKYIKYLQKVDRIYDSCPSVTVEFEYYVAQICLSKCKGHSEKD